MISQFTRGVRDVADRMTLAREHLPQGEWRDTFRKVSYFAHQLFFFYIFLSVNKKSTIELNVHHPITPWFSTFFFREFLFVRNN